MSRIPGDRWLHRRARRRFRLRELAEGAAREEANRADDRVRRRARRPRERAGREGRDRSAGGYGARRLRRRDRAQAAARRAAPRLRLPVLRRRHGGAQRVRAAGRLHLRVARAARARQQRGRARVRDRPRDHACRAPARRGAAGARGEPAVARAARRRGEVRVVRPRDGARGRRGRPDPVRRGRLRPDRHVDVPDQPRAVVSPRRSATRATRASSTRTRDRRSARRPTPCARARSAGSAIRRSAIRARRCCAGSPGSRSGQRPEAGIFQGDRFLHPALGFTVRFPSGWRQSNSNRAVGAMQPRGEAVVFLAADAPPGEVGEVARGNGSRSEQETPSRRGGSRPVKVGGIDAWRVEASARGRSGSVRAQLTFIPFHDATWRITGAAPAALASRHEGAMLATARSFRPLTAEERSGIEVTRLRVETARAGEGIAELSKRSGNEWSVNDTAVYNARVRRPPLRGRRAGQDRGARAVPGSCALVGRRTMMRRSRLLADWLMRRADGIAVGGRRCRARRQRRPPPRSRRDSAAALQNLYATETAAKAARGEGEGHSRLPRHSEGRLHGRRTGRRGRAAEGRQGGRLLQLGRRVVRACRPASRRFGYALFFMNDAALKQLDATKRFRDRRGAEHRRRRCRRRASR